MRQVWHIYYATKGTAGAYIDALLKASQVAGINSYAFVSSCYRYKFGKLVKCFFPITDFVESRNAAIKFLRGIELTLAYINILVLSMFIRPLVVLHLIDDLQVTYLFFKFCKEIGLKVRVTCHDVSSHYAGMNSIRSKILQQADELVVHNSAAERSLINTFGEAIKDKIRQYPFPFSAYDEIISKDRMKSVESRFRQQLGTGYYLFLGVVRTSKGINTLVSAWQEFNKDHRQKLVIAGKWTDPGENIRNIVDADDSITVIDRYLDDEEFVHLIQDAKFVVLPYLDYSHSSVIISCANHGGAVVISDIELFTRLLPNYALTFKRGDTGSLANLLKHTSELPSLEIKKLKLMLNQSVERETRNLVEDLKVAYRS